VQSRPALSIESFAWQTTKATKAILDQWLANKPRSGGPLVHKPRYINLVAVDDSGRHFWQRDV